MTTNVFDKASAILASDSRWSYELQYPFILFVDDTGYDKVVTRPTIAVVFAGRSDLIEQWKCWVSADQLNMAMIPIVPVDKDGQPLVAICIVQKPCATVRYDIGGSLYAEESRFAGSGASYAFSCWTENRCATTAVESAKKSDCFSGGTVTYLNLKDDSNNLSSLGMPYETIKTETVKRGIIMNRITKATIPLSSLPNIDRADIERSLASGDLVASAPIGYDRTKAWTDQDYAQLKAMFAEIANDEKQQGSVAIVGR